MDHKREFISVKETVVHHKAFCGVILFAGSSDYVDIRVEFVLKLG